MFRAQQPIFLVVFGAVNEPISSCMEAQFYVSVLNDISFDALHYSLKTNGKHTQLFISV